jgi:hypothetical protein
MRTTLTIDYQTAQSLKQIALESGKTLKQVINEALRAGLQQSLSPQPRRYRLKPASLGVPRSEMDLAKALRLADSLEDETLTRKLEQRK